MGKKVTIKDVAKASGVSIATVSQILNGHTKNFNPKTIEKVKQVKEEMNYEADYFARRMVGKKSKTIGVMVPDITNPFFSTFVRGVEEVLYQENFIPMLYNVERDNIKENNALEELSRRGVDGFIIASSAISNEEINRVLRNKKHPFIILDQKSSDGDSDTIGTDDFLGGQLAGGHLLELGHKEVSIVIPKRLTSNIENRIKGFESIFKGTTHIVKASLSKEGGKEAAPAILLTNSTAIFAVNDEIAFGLYHALKKAGKKIPTDYSIIGYDNVEMCEYVTPELTTIAQPIVELGREAAQMLLNRVEDPKQEWQNKILPVNIINRFSTTHA